MKMDMSSYIVVMKSWLEIHVHLAGLYDQWETNIQTHMLLSNEDPALVKKKKCNLTVY